MTMRPIVCAASLGLLCGVAVAQGSLFPNSFWYPAVDAPFGSTLADLDSDGKLDYLVANYYTDKVSVFLGTGTGLLNPLPPLSVGGQPRSLVVADLNGDNKPDLVTVNATSDRVSVLLGNGAGGFGTATLFATGSFPTCIDAGDLDGDGKMDIVTGNQAADSISVLFGDGLGGLGAPISHVVGSAPERLRLVDMNLDGHLDCVTADWLDDTVSVLLGNATGSLNFAYQVYVPSPKGLAVGDISGDGRPDLVVASSQYDVVYVFLGKMSGGLAAPKTHYLGSQNNYSTAVMIADASGDGRPDWISCGGSSNTLTVFIGVGAGDFGFAHSSPIPESAYDAVAGDLNGDGFADVVTSNLTADSIRVHMGAGVGSWERYCTAKTNSLGCVPTLHAYGTPSVSNPRPFWVVVSNVLNNKVGLLLYAVNGAQASTPFQGGTLCVGPAGIRRTPAQDSGNNPKLPTPNCSGSYARNFNAFAQGLSGGNPSPGLLVLGNSYQLQAWSRDPGFAAPNNSGLSPALDITPWQ